MALQALLLSNDPEVLKTIRRALDSVNIDLQVCHSAEEAGHILKRRKYDSILVDCDIRNAPAVLQDLRKGKSNKSCIAFALINHVTTIQQAFEMGANFVLDKPLAMDRTTRSVRAAHGLIMRERRRYHRHLLNATGTIIVDAGTELPVGITNISEGGISIECVRRLDEGGAARLKFLLPGARKPLEIKGEIAWSGADGRAGIRFQVLPVAAKEELEEWMEKRGILSNGSMFINATAHV
jgi:ActR/RegA family two-component response regulator